MELKYFRNSQPIELIEHIEPLEPFFLFRAKHAREQRRKGVVEKLTNKKQKIRNKEVEPIYFRNPNLLNLLNPLNLFIVSRKARKGAKTQRCGGEINE
jgi:hypothetical protein